MDDHAQRAKIIEVARSMAKSGLSPGRSGNVSARAGDGMLITPSGMPYDEMSVEDIVFVESSGVVGGGSRPGRPSLKPSSEWQFHLATYDARPDIHAHVHSHSTNATVLACAHKSIPAFHYMVAVAGGDDIPLVEYATFGSAELSRNVAGGLNERNACLIANHGQCAVGKTLDAAFELAQEVETLATQYVKLLELDAVHILPRDEMIRVLEKFSTYGQNAQDVTGRKTGN